MASVQIRLICISLTSPDMRIRIARNRQSVRLPTTCLSAA